MTTPAPLPDDASTTDAPAGATSAEAVEETAPADEPAAPAVANLDDLDPQQAAQIEAVVVDARVRRAPKFGAFIATGVVLGAVLGFLLSKIVGAVRHDPTNSGATAFFTALSLAMLGALISGYLAVRADRRS